MQLLYFITTVTSQVHSARHHKRAGYSTLPRVVQEIASLSTVLLVVFWTNLHVGPHSCKTEKLFIICNDGIEKIIWLSFNTGQSNPPHPPSTPSREECRVDSTVRLEQFMNIIHFHEIYDRQRLFIYNFLNSLCVELISEKNSELGAIDFMNFSMLENFQ